MKQSSINKPDKTRLVTPQNDHPVVNVVSSGRSNQSIIYHHTIQTQTSCSSE